MTAADATASNIRAEASPRFGADIEACDREPIHIPGSIQPHGLLLVVDGETGRIVAGAGAIEDRLAAEWEGVPLATVLGRQAAASAAAVREGAPVWLGEIGRPTDRFEAVASRSGALTLIEFEPAVPSEGAAAVLTGLEAFGAGFERAADLLELCEQAAISFRDITGFDRVMIYRFLDDDSGVVVAENRDPALGSFMNHHFPASDIPRQARALYIRNRVRAIPDIAYEPAPLRSASADMAELDLSDVGLRSVSPIHIQYLRNMNVGASASISIVKDGLLWGLVACHHRTPRALPYERRLICRTLAGGLARQIRAKEESESYRERLRLRSAEDSVLARSGVDASLKQFVAAAGADISRMLGANGFAAVDGRHVHTSGRCPDPSDILDLADWVKGRSVATPFGTRELSADYRPARAFPEIGSGLMAVTLSAEVPIVLLWFRAEAIEVVNWAGNPHKAVELKAGETLTPRASFENWSETVRGRSRPWTLGEVEATNRFRNALLELRQTHRLRELNSQLAATIADREGLLAQKDYLIKEVNHRVQNSLQLVSAFLHMQGRAVGDEVLSGHLSEAQRRLSAVALVHRRLYGDDLVETVDLARYLEDLCADLKSSMGSEWAESLTADLAPILIAADRAVNVGLILTELVINAQKYAYGGAPGPISIVLEQHRNRFRLIVADKGVGKTSAAGDAGRKGFGSRMLNAMIERLAGSIEETGSAPGLRVIVTAPIQPD